jgi:hypothetical protein
MAAILLFVGRTCLADDLVWSNTDTEKAPQGDVTFHGPFANETVEVRMDHLAPHGFLEVSFDLLVIRSWDGSVEMRGTHPSALGPDFFKLTLREGATLLFTTFSNRPDDPGFDPQGKFQNFPSPVAGDHLAPQTGAAGKNSLGYNYPWPNAPQAFPMDASYRIHLVVPHNSPQAVLQFTGLGLQNVIDESWGVTNLEVQPLTIEKVKSPDANEIAAAFGDAISTESDKQQEAFVTLGLGMDATVDWIRANVTPQPLDADRVAELIKLLAADDSNIPGREDAATELRGMGPALEPFLRDARNHSRGEQRVRIDWLLESIGVTSIDDENLRKLSLATRVLEIIGTPKAMELRRSLTTSP